YMSPEQLSGDTLDGRSDTYSLALVFYRMVTGTFPFQAANAQEMMIKRLTDDPLPLGVARPDIVFPTALEEAVRHALGRMPSERYATAVEFAHDVSSAVAGMGAAATAAPTEDATQILSPQDAPTAPALTPTRVRTAASTAPTPATPTTPQPQVPSPTAPTRKKAPVAAIAAMAVLIVTGGGYAALKAFGSSGEPETGLDTASVATPDSQQTGGQPGGGQRPGRNRDTAGGGTAPDTGGRVIPVAQVDTAAIAGELQDLFDRLPVDGPANPADLRRLDAIMSDSLVPLALRTRAAENAAQGYYASGNQTLACARIRQAMTWTPGTALHQTLFTSYECR
ncbi:MAG: hypothetical protein OEW56_09545, partial [Gemmatimonadota bacterium]|nr:hypothetical protein [Gemmatimonadota bacterium]